MKVLALTGGVGGAKLALGLSKVLGPEALCFVVNTGDDFEHLGLHISPDIDSLTYALAELNNTELGWGRSQETWRFMEALEQLGGEAWFRLGDQDLALHHQRRELLNSGATLTEATARITQAFGIAHRVLPMSDDPVRTMVATANGELAFQHYFVRDRCAPHVTGFRFDGIETAAPNPELLAWLDDCDGIIICPSNPYVSVDPILNLAGVRERIEATPTIAVSPIVKGLALKGPAAKMMRELNVPATAAAVADHYQGLIDGFVVDNGDENVISALTIPATATQTIMVTLEDRVALARHCVGFLQSLRS